MSTSRYIQRITTQEEVFLRWLVREETFSHTLRARISSVTEHLSSSLVLESNNNKLVNKLKITHYKRDCVCNPFFYLCSPFALVDVTVIIMIDASVDGTDYDVW